MNYVLKCFKQPQNERESPVYMASCYLLPGIGAILHLIYLFACGLLFVLKDALTFPITKCSGCCGSFEGLEVKEFAML